MICDKCQKEIYNKHSMYACDVMYRCTCNEKSELVQVRKEKIEAVIHRLRLIDVESSGDDFELKTAINMLKELLK